MSPPLVFDTGALALFYAEDERLVGLLDNSSLDRSERFVSSVTLAEFFYKTCQTLGRDVATIWSKQVSERMQVIEADLDSSLSAGLEKCRNNGLSLADCFVLTLAKQVKGLLLTTDSELARNKETPVKHFPVEKKH